jgi:hypothetical protein
MSLVIIAFKNAPVPNPEWKAKDEALDNEIRKKTIGKNKFFQENSNFIFSLIEIYNRNPNKTSLDANTVWQQVVTSLSEQSSIREALPIGGGFISKYQKFINLYNNNFF